MRLFIVLAALMMIQGNEAFAVGNCSKIIGEKRISPPIYIDRTAIGGVTLSSLLALAAARENDGATCSEVQDVGRNLIVTTYWPGGKSLATVSDIYSR